VRLQKQQILKLENYCKLLQLNNKRIEYFSGNYDPEVEEPLHSKANCAVVWEIHQLRRHYAPQVCKEARNLLHQVTKS